MNAGLHIVYRYMIHFIHRAALKALLRMGILHADRGNGGPVPFRCQYQGEQFLFGVRQVRITCGRLTPNLPMYMSGSAVKTCAA